MRASGRAWRALQEANHLRLFRQNGPGANTGALFLAVSQEEDAFENHTISPDGYDIGRRRYPTAAPGRRRLDTMASDDATTTAR